MAFFILLRYGFNLIKIFHNINGAIFSIENLLISNNFDDY